MIDPQEEHAHDETRELSAQEIQEILMKASFQSSDRERSEEGPETPDDDRGAGEDFYDDYEEEESLSASDRRFREYKNRRENGPATPALDKFGTDLTERALIGEIDPVIGRDAEIQRMMEILSRRSKNNPVMLGDPGVGKTACVEGLARKIAAGEVPLNLENARVIELDLTGMLAGTKYRGDFEERLEAVIKEATENDDVILFLDELHTLVSAGEGSQGSMDASNILKPALARGELKLIGATTFNEYRKYVEKDKALTRRFQPVNIAPPSAEETVEILKGLRENYEAHHLVTYSDKAIEEAVRLADRYLTHRNFPDKAIDILDEAGSLVRTRGAKTPDELEVLRRQLEAMTEMKHEAVDRGDYQRAADLRLEEKQIEERYEEAQEHWREEQDANSLPVSESDIRYVVALQAGVPAADLSIDEKQKYLELEDRLNEVVIGQEEGVAALARTLRRARSGLRDPERPEGSFLFLGPTGVGKTHLAKSLAKELFGDEDAMVRLDMSEYMERHAVSRLVGAPPGYVGHGEGGQLTEAVRRKPYSVVLLDEIEKAHPDAMNLLLQVLEEGRLTDSTGRKVDFRNTIIIMTSNLGANRIMNNAIGFASGTSESSKQQITAAVDEEVARFMRPELMNRLDEKIVFNRLSEDALEHVVGLEIAKVKDRLAARNISLTLDDAALSVLLENGYHPEYGARPLRRAIARLVEDPLSEELIRGAIQDGDDLIARGKDGTILFEVKKAISRPVEEAMAPESESSARYW